MLADCDEGLEIRQVAVKYRVSESWIRRLRQRRRENGEVVPCKQAVPPPKWLPYSEPIQRLIAERPDATLAELKAELGLPFSLQTLCRALQELRFTFKKVLRAAEQDRPDVAEKRSIWRTWQGRLKDLDLRRFVFLDERGRPRTCAAAMAAAAEEHG